MAEYNMTDLLIFSQTVDSQSKHYENRNKVTVKILKISDTQNICCNHPKSLTRWRFLRVMHPKDAEGIANSVDPLGAVWSVRKLRNITIINESLGVKLFIF